MSKYLLSTLALLPANLLAHPGPPGHIHDDDWPFDPLPMVAVVLAGIALALLLRRFRHGAGLSE